MSYGRTRGMRTSRHKLHRVNGGRRAPHTKTKPRPPQFRSTLPPPKSWLVRRHIGEPCRRCGVNVGRNMCPLNDFFGDSHPQGPCGSERRDQVGLCGRCLADHMAELHPDFELVKRREFYRWDPKRRSPQYFWDAVHRTHRRAPTLLTVYREQGYYV